MRVHTFVNTRVSRQLVLPPRSEHTTHMLTYTYTYTRTHTHTRVGAYIAFPKEAGKLGLRATAEELFATDTSWDESVDILGFRPVKLELPRFKVEYGVKSLKHQLSEMGMAEVFGPSATFDRMTGSQTHIEDVFHKAVIEVNEEGTVAAAATAVVMTRSLPPPPIELKVDRPFLFVVYDLPAKTVLFVAKVETV